MQSQFTACSCGCGSLFPSIDRKGRARLWVRGHFNRRPLTDRFWEKVNKDGPVPDYAPHLGSCWIWTAALTKGPNAGYGHIKVGRKDRPAHIVSYEWENGPVPGGLELDHLCRVRHCVRPSHLEAVTHRENALRGEGVFGDVVNRYKTHCPQGHEYTPENTWVYSVNNSRHCRACLRIKANAFYHRRMGHAPKISSTTELGTQKNFN